MQFFRSLAELFPRFARRSGALERAVRPSLQSRRLRLEPLENRELLAVDAFAVPFGPPPLENVANEAAPVVVSSSVLADDGATLSVRTETPEPVAPLSFEQLMESLGQVKIESLDAETDVASSSESEETQNELQPRFIVDGVEYYPLSQAVARRVVFEDSGVDVASLDEPFVIVPNANAGEEGVYNAQSGGSGGSGGETSVWTLNFSGGVSNSNNENPLGALTSLGIENALLERATTVSGGASFGENGASGGAASGGGDEIESLAPNYLKVTLPALPDYYEAEVVFTGTAALGVDYEIHAPREVFNQYYNNSCFTYSGGSTQFFVLPINDAQPESLEDFTATLEQPTPTVVSGGSSYAQSYDFIFESSSVTATFVDDDHWKVSVEASDSTATERLADVEQDYGYYTFKREHQNPDVAAKIDAKVQELTKADATNAEIDDVKELAALVTGDATYSVTVDFEALYNSESNYDAEPTVDYALSTSPLATESADAYLASFEFSSTPNQSEAPLWRYDCSGVIPASKTEALLRLNPVFDWEDEGELFNPNYLIDAALTAAPPNEQLGEKARLRLLDATWNGQGADYNPLAEPTTAAVEIKDGAIAELYFDYDGDGTLDPYQSTADETCYVPINNDDDNLNGVEDREESAAVANENDLRKFVAVAWLAHYGNHTLEASVTVGGNNVEFWQNDAGTIPLEPLGAEGEPVEVVDSTAGTGYHFAGVCEGVFGGDAAAGLEVKLDDGDSATPPIVHNDDASLKTTSYWIDLDVDSDNNGYINDKTENPIRADAEEAMEESVGKPITYFGNATGVHREYAYVPIYVNLQTTDSPLLSSDASNIRVSFSYTKNLEIYRVKGDANSIIKSNVKKPVSEYLQLGVAKEFYVRAIKAETDTGFANGFDKIHVIVWDGDVEIHRDTVSFDVQDGNDASDWIVPSGWRIGEDGSLTTYAIREGAVGPLKPGSSITEKEGCAYSRQAFTDGFTLSFNYEFLHNEDYSEVTKDGNYGYVQGDSNKDGKIIKKVEKPGEKVDEQKLSFVGNSGVKIGGFSGVPEVAILDMQAIMLMLGNGNESEGLNRFINGVKIDEETGDPIVEITGYATENLAQLLSGCVYNQTSLIPKITFEDFSVTAPLSTTWYQQWFEKYYNTYKNTNHIEIRINNITTENTRLLSVYLNNESTPTYIYQLPNSETNNDHLYLQSHHGSGVRFSNISLEPLN